MISGDDQQGRPGDLLSPIVVAVRDSSGKPVPGARVQFWVTAGDGLVGVAGAPIPGGEWVASGPSYQLTDQKGEALMLWWLGRHGQNNLLAIVESEERPLQLTFSATSVSGAYAPGSFALTPTGTSITLVEGWGGEGTTACIARSGSLVLERDGTFEATAHFDCSVDMTLPFSFGVTETGFYAVSDSVIVLRYLTSDDRYGLLNRRAAHGLASDEMIVVRSYGANWQYTKDK